MRFRVLIREVHVSHRIVEASSRDEAMELVGDADEVYCEYSHTLPKETWTIEKEDDAAKPA